MHNLFVLVFTFLRILFETRNENIPVMKRGNRIDVYKGFICITRIRQELQEQDSGKNLRKKESCKNYKKNRIRQEHKNLGWREISCLVSQDSGYMDLARKSRSLFSGKNLVQKEWKKNLACKPRKTRTWKNSGKIIHLCWWFLSNNIF
jgi:hypothetical protein